jgi:hypothetical protein
MLQNLDVSKSSKTYNAWRFRRQQLSLERWAETRAKGKARFVLRQAFTFLVLMTAFRDVYYQIFAGVHVFSLGFDLILFAINGIFIGYAAWDLREDEYKGAQLKSSLQAGAVLKQI